MNFEESTQSKAEKKDKEKKNGFDETTPAAEMDDFELPESSAETHDEQLLELIARKLSIITDKAIPKEVADTFVDSTIALPNKIKIILNSFEADKIESTDARENIFKEIQEMFLDKIKNEVLLANEEADLINAVNPEDEKNRRAVLNKKLAEIDEKYTYNLQEILEYLNLKLTKEEEKKLLAVSNDKEGGSDEDEEIYKKSLSGKKLIGY